MVSFHSDELVLARDGSHVYDATVLKTDPTRKRYLVHYRNYNKRFDRWVDSAQLLKRTEANIAKHTPPPITNPSAGPTAGELITSTKPIPTEVRATQRAYYRRSDALLSVATSRFAVELFAGLGSLARGIRDTALPHDTRHVLVDIDAHSIVTLRRNFPSALVLHGDAEGFARLMQTLFDMRERVDRAQCNDVGGAGGSGAVGGKKTKKQKTMAKVKAAGLVVAYRVVDVRWRVCDPYLLDGVLDKALQHAGKYLPKARRCLHKEMKGKTKEKTKTNGKGKKKMKSGDSCACGKEFELRLAGRKGQKGLSGAGGASVVGEWMSLVDSVKVCGGDALFLEAVGAVLPLYPEQTYVVASGPPCKEISGYVAYTIL